MTRTLKISKFYCIPAIHSFQTSPKSLSYDHYFSNGGSWKAYFQSLAIWAHCAGGIAHFCHTKNQFPQISLDSFLNKTKSVKIRTLAYSDSCPYDSNVCHSYVTNVFLLFLDEALVQTFFLSVYLCLT